MNLVAHHGVGVFISGFYEVLSERETLISPKWDTNRTLMGH